MSRGQTEESAAVHSSHRAIALVVAMSALLAMLTVAAAVAVQLWIALRFASFVPALATGIAGTFFVVVASSAKIGVVLPWQLPINQLASDPGRAQLALAVGMLGRCAGCVAMLALLSRRDVV